MSLLMRRNPATLDPASSETSPVTWHVVLWVLLPLALNSMTQPSGRLCGTASRYRVYLCSSPLFCFADGLSILVRLIVTSAYLQISPVKSSRLAIISRADERHDTKRCKDTCFDDPLPESEEHSQSVDIRTWPRWVFFIVGTLPAAIKLASFSGLPGTQTLGLMFVTSFAVIELVTFLSTFEEKHNSIPEVLGYKKVEGQTIEEQELRFKVYKLMVGLEWFETAILIATILTYSGLTVTLVAKLSFAATSAIPESNVTNLINLLYTSYILLVTLVIIVYLFVGFFCIWPVQDRWTRMGKLILLWLKCMYWWSLFPHKPQKQSCATQCSSWKWLNYRAQNLGPYFALLILFYRLMPWLCERWPAIAKGLLIDWRAWDLEKMEHLTQRERTGAESETGVLHTRACASFASFLNNLVVCVLWYAFIYDSTGTINPSWTAVFG